MKPLIPSSLDDRVARLYAIDAEVERLRVDRIHAYGQNCYDFRNCQPCADGQFTKSPLRVEEIDARLETLATEADAIGYADNSAAFDVYYGDD